MSSQGRHRWLAAGLGAVFIIANILVNPWLARERSLIAISAYDLNFEQKSIARRAGISVQQPLGEAGMYPILITYNDDQAMSRWLGTPVEFTVDFSFADFLPWQGHSAFYEPDDPRYGAYVGAYYLQGLGRPLTEAEVQRVAEFDQRMLALPAIGLGFKQNHFDVLTSSSSSAQFGGLDWTTHDALVSTNCPDHSPSRFLPAYIQFGWPPPTSASYPTCELTARIEVTYLADRDVTLGLYLMAASPEEAERLSAQVIRRSTISLD